MQTIIVWSGGRYLINDDNIDTAIDIMENLGAYTECI